MKKLAHKLLSFLLIYIIILTGCSNSKSSYGYSLPIEDIYLGITYEELIKVLDLSNTELLKSELKHANYIKIHKQQVLNEEATVIYSFFDYETGYLKDKLFSITIEFDDIDIEAFLGTLEKIYGEYRYYFNDNSMFYVWEKETLSTLTDETIDKMKVIEASGYSNLSENQLEYIDLAYKSALNTAISSIRFISRSNPTDNHAYYSLFIEGKYAVFADLAKK